VKKSRIDAIKVRNVFAPPDLTRRNRLVYRDNADAEWCQQYV